MSGDVKDCVKGAQIEGRVIALENQIKKDELDCDKKFEALFRAVGDIRDHLIGRPSWPIVFILTMLSSICVGLAVKLISKGGL